MSAMQKGEQRFLLLPTGRHLLPVAVGLGALLAIFGAGALRLAFLGAAALLLLLHLLLSRRRPVLVLDGEGYRVERGGREVLRVRWTEARRVLLDKEEQALYVDCGDGARSLLVPPRRGWAFTFSDRERLVAAVLAAVPDRIEEVADLSRTTLTPPAGEKSS